MARLIITADIHGHYGSWQLIRNLLKPSDTLAIAGDLFDTKYQSIPYDEYAPERIRDEFTRLSISKYYVYGNCDQQAFLPDHEKITDFVFGGKRIQLRHGHFKKNVPASVEIIIEGHSHIAQIQKNASLSVINPGSIPLPRKGPSSYAILHNQIVQLFDAETHNPFQEIKL